MYSVEDIDVYVMTHNRRDFLLETLESLVRQTERVREITVLDNESTDGTVDAVNSFKNWGVGYVKTRGKYGNFFEAQKRLSLNKKKYILTFHDDDVLHPEFFEKMVLALNSLSEDPSLLISTFTWFPTHKMSPSIRRSIEHNLPDAYLNPKPLSDEFLILRSPEEMVKLILLAENPPYPQINPCICSAIYRRDVFLQRKPMNDVYGRQDDHPLMIDLASRGHVILFLDNKSVFHRTHRGRDGFSIESRSTIEQITNWVKVLSSKLDKKDKSYYEKLVYLIGTHYPFVCEKYGQNGFSTKDFIFSLVRDKVLPSFCTKFPIPQCDYLPKEETFIDFNELEKLNIDKSVTFGLEFDAVTRMKINPTLTKLAAQVNYDEVKIRRYDEVLKIVHVFCPPNSLRKRFLLKICKRIGRVLCV